MGIEQIVSDKEFSLFHKGQVLEGKQDSYEVLAGIDIGGFAEVYLASDEAGRHVAVKALKPESAFSPETQYVCLKFAFMNETTLLRDKNHSNIVRLLDYSFDGDSHFYVMEYLPNNLDVIPVTDRRLKQLLKQGTRFLRFAEEEGILHCDIKPSNIGLDRTGKFKVCDFGSAVDRTNRYTSEQFYYTPDFAPPEFKENQAISETFDMYCFGRTVEKYLAGEVFPTVDLAVECIEDIHEVVLPPSFRRLLSRMTDWRWMYRPSAQELNRMVSDYCSDVAGVQMFGQDDLENTLRTERVVPLHELGDRQTVVMTPWLKNLARMPTASFSPVREEVSPTATTELFAI